MTTARPEPVLDAAELAGRVAALVVAVCGLAGLVLAGRLAELDALGIAVGGVLTAGAALASYLAPAWQARKARTKVTPLEDPRTIDGEALVVRLEPDERDQLAAGDVATRNLPSAATPGPDHAAPE